MATPSSLNALWWIDYTDLSTLTVGFGNIISQARDKIANVPFDAPFPSGPTLTLQYLGLSGTALNGGTALSNTLGTYTTPFSAWTWFCHMYDPVTQNGGRIMMFSQGNDPLGAGQGGSFVEAAGGSGTPGWRSRSVSNTVNFLNVNQNPTLSAFTFIAIRAYQDGPDMKLDFYENGSIVQTGTLSSNTMVTLNDAMFFLNYDGGLDYTTEQFFFDRKLDDTEVGDMFSYFNVKYPPLVPTPTPTPTITATNTPTPSITPTNTSTPTVTPTNTPSSNTPTPTPTNTLTPTVTRTPEVPEKTINFKTIADDLKRLGDEHKFINSFGLGDTDQIAWLISQRDKTENTTFESPIFPLYFVVPGPVQNNLRYKTWEFNNIVMDIAEGSLFNQEDTLSDTLQTLQDIMSQFRLSVSPEFGNYNLKYWLDETVQCLPFIEQYQDQCNGWNANIRIKTMTPLDRCAAAFNTFTGTPIQHEWINLKSLVDDLLLLAEYHKQIKSWGFGSMQDLIYWVEMRDKKTNPTFESPIYPLMYVVPSSVQQEITDDGSSWTNYQMNVMILDILEDDLSNQVDVLSDTNQILDDVISQFRLSVTDSLGNFNEKYYLDETVICNPIIEKFDDYNGGWNGILNIKVMTPLDRCAAAFDSFLTPTPTNTPTNTVTPSVSPTNTPTLTLSQTPTNTPTQTQTQTPTETLTPTPTQTPTVTQSCPITTQYLEVQLSDSAKFKLILWNQPNFTSAANAECDYIISGTAYGSLGTVYSGTETINQGQHQHQFNLAPVLLPGEDVIDFDVWSYSASTCPCPLILILPPPITPTPTKTPTQTPTPTVTSTQTPTQTSTQTPTPSLTPNYCRDYTLIGSGFGTSFNWTNCNGTAGSVVLFGTTQTICAINGTVTQSGPLGTITAGGDCSITPTPTPTQTSTNTPTPSMTPTNTPTNTQTPTNTPSSETPTPTPTPSSTPLTPPPADDCIWNTNNTNWNNDSNTWDSCSNVIWNTNTNQWENEIEDWND